MAAKLSKLAKKYREALDAAEAARQQAEAAREAWLAEAAAARTSLLAELVEFAIAAGLEATAGRGRLVLSWNGRTLAITDGAEGDTLDTDAGVQLRMSPEGAWSVDGEELIDRGLRRLLVNALGVPDPGGEFGEAAQAPKAVTRPPEPAPIEAAPEPHVAAAAAADGKGPSSGEIGHLGRSGTRGFRRAKDVSPGGLVKDLKGPGPV